MNKLQVVLCVGLVIIVIALFNRNVINDFIDNALGGGVAVTKGMKYMDEEKYEEAIIQFNIYLNKGYKIPNKSLLKQVYYQKSLAYSKLYLYEMCEKYINLAIEINEVTFDEKIMKAHAAYYKGSYEEALELYNELISIEPKTEFLLARGDCYMKLEQYVKANEEYKKIFETEPSFTHFQKLINAFYYQKNNEILIELARDYIKKLHDGAYLAEDKNEALNYAYCEIGYAQIDLKQYKEAINNFNNAIRFNENDSYSFFQLALCYSILENYDLAAKNLEKALIIDEDYYYIDELDYYDEFSEFIKTDQYKVLRQQYY